MVSLTTCQQNTKTTFPLNDLTINWELKENSIGGKLIYKAAFNFINQSDIAFPAKDWAMYFNKLPIDVRVANDSPLQIERINGDFFRVLPTENFKGLAAGDSISLEYESNAWIVKESDAPCGLYFTFDNESIIEVAESYNILPFERTEQFKRGESGVLAIPTAETLYEENEKYNQVSSDNNPPFIPSPISFNYKKDSFKIDVNTTIYYQTEALENEANFLATSLEKVLGTKPPISAGVANDINGVSLNLKNQKVKGISASAYKLEITANKGIAIEATDAEGVFYGIQSLLGMIPPNQLNDTESISFRAITVKDAPAFGYRGMHLDASRNFHPKSSVLKLLDMMAFYKLNKFHFHLTDDEGWRLEIKSLPELTAYGSRRAHTLDEEDHLFPAYGSGPYEELPGSGHYSRQDFIEILKYANERHIEVIPELDLPGHARAAIKAMEYRYKKHMSKGDEKGAFAFLLSDEDDTSTYSSVQGYSDNVVCACRESTYDFLEVVVSEIVSMYESAGVKLKTLHTGGDEVPGGAWVNSPICQAFLESQDKYNEPRELSAYFFSRFSEILRKFSVRPAGWEEIALKVRNHGEKHQVNEDIAKEDIQAYVWNTIYGEGVEDLPYLLANAGVKIVMSNAPNLYFDFAYSRDPRDRGYYWGGLVNARQSYKLVPYNHFLTAEKDKMGQNFDLKQLTEGKLTLEKKSQDNILGIQGQLWSETVKSPEMMEYYIFPKLLGLAERAWVGNPAWANEKNLEKQWKDFDKAFGEFASYIGNYAIPQMDYYWDSLYYRIPPPGAIKENGMLYANTLYPGLAIRYTTDGTEPNINSTLYTEPIAVNSTIKLKAFNDLERGSFVTVCK